MTDRSDRSSQPGPWPEASDATRLYDHGQRWCINAGAHPDANGGYPDGDRHLPWDECRSAEAYVDDARRDLDGTRLGISVYAAAPFRFGQPRDHASVTTARVVIEIWTVDSELPAQRLSIGPADALRLAHILTRAADVVIFDRAA